jgi:hypothetical protein
MTIATRWRRFGCFINLGRNPAFVVLLATGASFAYSASLAYAYDRTTHNHHSLDRRLGTGVWSRSLRASNVLAAGTCPPDLQRDICGRCERRLSQRWVWCLGIVISGDRDTNRIYGLAVLPVDRHRLADAFLLGYRAPRLGQSHLAIHADIFVRLHDFRCCHSLLVYRQSTGDSAEVHSFESTTS